jgi:hypothetical protein
MFNGADRNVLPIFPRIAFRPVTGYPARIYVFTGIDPVSVPDFFPIATGLIRGNWEFPGVFLGYLIIKIFFLSTRMIP